jgi:tetratricopeptide (TPR) repeat protein
VLADQGRLAEAETTHLEALVMRRKLFGNEHPEVSNSLLGLASVLAAEGKLDEAETMYREVVAIRRKLLGNEHPELANALNNLAAVLTDEGKLAEAETVAREALAMRKKLLGNEHPDVALSLAGLAFTLLAQEKFAEAEAPARECLAIREQKMPDDWRTFTTRSLLGGSLLGQKKYAQAEPLLVSGYEGMKQREDKIPAGGKRRLKDALQRVVQLYEATDRSDQAAQWKEKLAGFSKAEAEKNTTPHP